MRQRPVADIAAFLTDSYAEDESAALAAARVYGRDWHIEASDPFRVEVVGVDDASHGALVALDVEGVEAAGFIARFDPRQVLRGVEAGRRELAELTALRLVSIEAELAAERIMAIRASVYSGHPDYDPRMGAGVSEPDVLIVRDADWPHGLRCADCARLMRDGEPYAERWTGMAGDVPVIMICCTACEPPAGTVRQ